MRVRSKYAALPLVLLMLASVAGAFTVGSSGAPERSAFSAAREGLTAGGATAGATCTQAQKQRRLRALNTFRKTVAAKRSAYFRTHPKAADRKAFVKRQQAKLATLKRAAACKTASAPAQTSRMIGPSGGEVSLGDVGSVSFPDGSFRSASSVKLAVSKDPATDASFGETELMFGAGTRLPYELRITTGSVQPLTDVEVSFSIPESFRASVPADSEIRVFAENLWVSGDEALDTFELLPERFTASDATARVTVSSTFFTKSRRRDGAFELVVLLATTPTKVAAAANPLRRSTQQAAACEGTTLGPPLDQVEYTSHFGPRDANTGAGSFHRGSDLRAANGTPVRAMADGTVELVNVDERTQADGRRIGWGQYLVLRHEDGSRSLYAHLERGSTLTAGTQVNRGDVIARSDTTGGATGPHLHVEYAPNGQIFNRDTKVDPEPCIGGNVTGSITVADNGNIADDAFRISINGRVVCETQIGATNTCAVGNLRPGKATLTITAIVAPDDVGTYGITLSNGLTFQDGTTEASGELTEGGSESFTIVIPG